MRPSRFSEEQILQALQQVRAGTPAVEMCRKLGITQTTFYRWRGKYQDASLNESRLVRELRDENHRLREIVADLLLERQRVSEIRRKR
jgi:putative transposase